MFWNQQWKEKKRDAVKDQDIPPIDTMMVFGPRYPNFSADFRGIPDVEVYEHTRSWGVLERGGIPSD